MASSSATASFKSYRHLWALALGTALAVSLLPLILLSLFAINQFDNHDHLQRQEMNDQVQRLLSNSRLQIADFLKEHQAALTYVVQENSLEQLSDPRQISRIFLNLRRAFGGFVDLGVINAKGDHKAYAGPYSLESHNYSGEDWFREVVIRGVFISDVFLGHRNVPHFVIAVKHEQDDGSFYMLRATINNTRVQEMLAQIGRPPYSDAFMINQAGFLQTPSRFFGSVLEVLPLPLPHNLKKDIEVVTMAGLTAGEQIAGFARVGASPFTVVLIKRPGVIMKKWTPSRLSLLLLLALSGLGIIAIVFYGVTGMVNRLYLADLRKANTQQGTQIASKLDSLGRLATGVAHEINDPISVINEKAGLVADLLKNLDNSKLKVRLQSNVESILGSVKRVSVVTNRLLGLARRMDVRIEAIDLPDLLREVLSFLDREAEYRGIEITLDCPPDLPTIESNGDQLQQVFLNIINNSLAAIPDGGSIHISVRQDSPRSVMVDISDTGAGIPQEHLDRIFEPFFAARGEQWGTGLGLSITQGLVQSLGGHIMVSSQQRQGTTFSVILPMENQG
jgi:signal transduction histidine kinase